MPVDDGMRLMAGCQPAYRSGKQEEVTQMFSFFDDPEVGPRLRGIGITDDDIVCYIVNRARGATPNNALATMLSPYDPELREADFVRSVVEQIPIVKNL